MNQGQNSCRTIILGQYKMSSDERRDAEDAGPEYGDLERRRESPVGIFFSHVQLALSLLDSAI